MQAHLIRQPADGFGTELLERNFRLRHAIFVEEQGWDAIRQPDRRDVDAFDTLDATHLLLTDGEALVGGSRFTPLRRPNLLQSVFADLVEAPLPFAPARGMDWTRFYVRSDRRSARRAPESAALFCTVMEYALRQELRFITFVSSLAMLEHGTSVGWRITPLGAPRRIDGKPTVAAWIEVSNEALQTVRRVTGCTVRLPPDAEPLPAVA